MSTPTRTKNHSIHIRELKKMDIAELIEMGKDLGIENAAGLKTQELIFDILQKKAEKDEHIYVDGVLDCLSEGFGFLRAPDYNYLQVLTMSMYHLLKFGVLG